MEISTSKYSVVSSGSLLVPENDYLEFSFQNLRFRFVFSPEEIDFSVKDHSINGTIKTDEKGDYLELEISNYNSLFSTPGNILKVGEIDGKDLYLHFSVVPLMKDNNHVGVRVLTYTWYKDN